MSIVGHFSPSFHVIRYDEGEKNDSIYGLNKWFNLLQLFASKIERKNNEIFHFAVFNLTDKFIRTFLRLKYHFNSVKISSFPSELDFNLHLKLEDVLVGNNDFLNEVTSLVYKNNSKKRN